MASLLRILGSRWFLGLIGTGLLSALLWEFGPFVPALEDWLVRVALVASLLLIWAGANLLLDRRDRGRDAALSAGVAASASAEEAAAMRDKLAAALALLKRSRGARGFLYEQPWYVIIGPPGAGKTTALLNCGLRFPLAAELGHGPVAGVGGTRLCDWWFTDDAVLIDTAGRYTTQDSDAAVDRAGWEAFLDLLRRTRARQPLNGVIVAISITDIAAAHPAERHAHAQAIRGRVRELEARLGLRLPVYALFTKCDLLAGFTEFFDDLDRETRAQVWGATFAPGHAVAGPVGAFAAEFRALAERIDARLIDRLQAERNAERRGRLVGFPAQFASLAAPLDNFLREAFAGAEREPAPLLRGFYFTSATQAGTPIDRLTGALIRTFGLDQRQAPSLRPEAGRSYFLARLLQDVIFNEAMLASAPPAARRRRAALRAAGFAVLGLAATLLAGLLYGGRVSGQAEIDAEAAALVHYEQAARAEPLDPVADADLPRLLPLLDAARTLPHGYDRAGERSGGGIGGWFGLAQDDKLEASARAVYRHALGNALLPRLIWRLETQIRGNLARPDFVYEATRVYLMLGGAGPLDRELVRAWMRADWSVAFAGPALAAARDGLLRHLDAMLAEPLPAIGLDGALVVEARATFGRVPLAQRVYSRIKPSRAAAALPAWKPADALGAAGAVVFIRASGKPLADGIAGFLTIDGFHKVLLPSLGPAARTVASESWVLGQNAAVELDGPRMKNLERDVIALYEADYARAWDALLGDLDVAPLRSLTRAAQDLYILASPHSPMRDLLAAVARQLQLSVPPSAPDAPGGVVTPAQAGVLDVAATGQAQLDTLLGAGSVAGPAPRPPGAEIDERYKPLIDLVGNGPGAPLDQVLRVLGDLQQQLAKLAAAPPGSAVPPPPAANDPALGLRVEAQRQPQPLGRWLAAIATSGTALRGGGAREQIAAAFNGPGGPATLCAPAVAGHYPFDRASATDMPLDDFAKLFAPGGLIDGFFNTQLRPYVDMSGPTWKPQPVEGVAPPVTQDTLAQFQRAAVIRDLFFTAGTTPTLRFDITPTSLDAGARQVTLDLDGTELSYAHGPPRATQVMWPGPTRMQTVRLVFDPPPAGGPGGLSATGPWALFRLLDQGKRARSGSAERDTLSFQLGARSVSYEIRAGSVPDPLAPAVLRDFRCPVLQ